MGAARGNGQPGHQPLAPAAGAVARNGVSQSAGAAVGEAALLVAGEEVVVLLGIDGHGGLRLGLRLGRTAVRLQEIVADPGVVRRGLASRRPLGAQGVGERLEAVAVRGQDARREPGSPGPLLGDPAAAGEGRGVISRGPASEGDEEEGQDERRELLHC